MGSLPALERSYDFETNWLHNETGNGVTDRRYCALKLYQTLLGFAHNPWTLVASSNASTAGWPGPGWSSIADVNSGTNRSWFVMENIHGVQILYSMTTSTSNADIWICPDGSLSGGAINAEPTGNAIQTATSYDWWSGTNTETVRLNFWHAQDGTFDFFTCLRTDNGQNSWAVVLAAKVYDTPAEWTLPWVQAAPSQASSAAISYPTQDDGYNYDWLDNTLWVGYKGPGGDTPFAGKLSADICNGVLPKDMFNGPNQISGKWQFFPLAFIIETPGSYGIMGRMPDFYASPAALVNGDSIEEDPATPSWLWVVQGEFVFPWNGSQMLTSL